MPKRVIDFDAMWGSDKLASCAEWAQAEYAWLYGLADASGCFELTNLRVIWGRVAAIRRNLTIERLEQIFDEFQVKGLLFVWEHEGKRYGHWTGSDVPGRLPAPSWRMRLERLAPPVPKRQFAEYMSRFSRGRAGLAGGNFRGETELRSAQGEFENSNLKFEAPGTSATENCRRQIKQRERFEIPDLQFGIPEGKGTRPGGNDSRENTGDGALRSLKGRLEEAQAQDWNSDGKLDGEKELGAPDNRAAYGEAADQRAENPQNPLLDLNSKTRIDPSACSEGHDQQTKYSQKPRLYSNSNAETGRADQHASGAVRGANRVARSAAAGVAPGAAFSWRDKSDLLARELAVGRGPVCGPVKVKPEALERIRAREEARRAATRSP